MKALIDEIGPPLQAETVTYAIRALTLALLLSSVGACTRRVPRLQPVKPATIEALGPRIEAAAGEGVAALSGFFSWAELAERATPEGLNRAERPGFVEGVRAGLESDGSGMLAAIVGGHYSYRGIAWRDGRPVARFRYLPPDGGFNFHDLLIMRSNDGSVSVVDIHVLTSSEYLSVSMRRVAVLLIGDRSDLVGRIFGSEAATEAEIEDVRAFSGLVGDGDPDAALAAYDALPPRMQRSRHLRFLRVQAASRLEDQARYLAILRETAVNLPNDPALSSLMLDAHFLSGDWAGCLADLAVLREQYDDPYIDAFEGRVHVAAGDMQRGLQIADRVIAAEDTLLDGHDVALLAALGLGDADRARLELRGLVENHGVNAELLATMAGYEGISGLGAP